MRSTDGSKVVTLRPMLSWIVEGSCGVRCQHRIAGQTMSAPKYDILSKCKCTNTNNCYLRVMHVKCEML